ncbi:hypothetical protein ACQPWY_26780 [Pseudonocardia xinjiangensis]|uniref:hypothetical protein n=1 Tax=Pseudonocardia xinjiangensis TaxID=75289 RepID=UPI003D92B401
MQPTATMISEYTATLFTGYRQSLLQDPEYPELDEGPRTSEIAIAGTGMVEFNCVGQFPEPTVRFEVWSGRPIRGPVDEIPGFEGLFDVVNPLVVLGSPTSASTDLAIPLPRSGPYAVQAWRYLPAESSESRIIPGAQVEPEDWLIRIWPHCPDGSDC